jgi:hypothetical protein
MNVYKLKENTLLERLRANYMEGYEISESDMRIKKRWEAAYAMLSDDMQNDRSVAKMIASRFNVDISTAYVDIRDCKKLYGDVLHSNKEALRNMVTQWSIDFLRKANHTNNMKSIEKALERITKANNLDKEDQDLPDPAKIQPPVQLLTLNFNFINSPRFKLIDESAQAAILKLYDEFMEKLELSPLAEYSDMFQINPSARPEKQ